MNEVTLSKHVHQYFGQTQCPFKYLSFKFYQSQDKTATTTKLLPEDFYVDYSECSSKRVFHVSFSFPGDCQYSRGLYMQAAMLRREGGLSRSTSFGLWSNFSQRRPREPTLDDDRTLRNSTGPPNGNVVDGGSARGPARASPRRSVASKARTNSGIRRSERARVTARAAEALFTSDKEERPVSSLASSPRRQLGSRDRFVSQLLTRDFPPLVPLHTLAKVSNARSCVGEP